MARVAIVTGANKGIGLAIVKAFVTPGPTEFDGVVILTARDETRGKEAIKELGPNGKKVVFHQLDVSNKESINKLKKFVTDKYGRLDVLVNNAGIGKTPGIDESKADVNVVAVNYFAVVDVCDALFPLLQDHARVVFVGSGLGNKGIRESSDKIQEQLMSEDLTLETLNEIMKGYMKFEGKTKEEVKKNGYCNFAYAISKSGVNWLGKLYQRQFDKLDKDIIANGTCPGWVATDMGGKSAKLTADEGADTPVYLSLLKPGVKEPRGKFLRKREVLKWPDTTA